MNTATLSPQWQDWIAQNLARGCATADMLASMVGAGIDEARARQAILAAQPLLDAKRATLEYPECRLDLGDHETQVLMTLRSPHVTVLQGFLSDAECELIISLSRPKLQLSRVVDNSSGKETFDPVRTSYGTYFVRGSTPELHAIEARLACLSGLPVTHGEGIQVLRYGIGARYVPHFDFFPPEVPGSAAHVIPQRGGQRIATVVMYLNTVPLGGETEFPDVGCKVAAVKGNACFFSYMDADGKLDRRSLHSGNAVEAGEKWIATWWMRQGPYGA